MKWYENMRISNLPRGYGLPLLPSPDRSGGWNTLPLSAEASTAWLRHLLLKSGTERGALMSYGTHSLKATVLSWLAKRGIPRELRAALGYHAKAVDGTEVVYGRDNMAAPLRTMIGVICEVSEGSFRPDATKSGMLITRLKPTVEISTGDVLADAGLTKAGEQLHGPTWGTDSRCQSGRGWRDGSWRHCFYEWRKWRRIWTGTWCNGECDWFCYRKMESRGWPGLTNSSGICASFNISYAACCCWRICREVHVWSWT